MIKGGSTQEQQKEQKYILNPVGEVAFPVLTRLSRLGDRYTTSVVFTIINVTVSCQSHVQLIGLFYNIETKAFTKNVSF